MTPLRLQGVGGRGKPRSEEARQGISRISRLVALAHHFDELLEQRLVSDYADLARLCHVTRARITQIMNLRQLAPDIQEELLFLLPPRRGRARITESSVRAIASLRSWSRQRQLFAQLMASSLGRSCR